MIASLPEPAAEYCCRDNAFHGVVVPFTDVAHILTGHVYAAASASADE